MGKTEQTLTIGIDLSKDYTQVSYLNMENSVVSMSTVEGEQKYQIPTLLFKYFGKQEWCIGEEALNRQKERQGILIRNLLDEVMVGSVTELEGKEYFASELLEIYFRELFKKVTETLEAKEVRHVVVSVPELKKTLMDAVFDGIVRIGLKKEDIKIIGHAESFIYYVLNQPRDLWVNHVALFEFSQYGFFYYKMSFLNGRMPSIVTVEKKEFTEQMQYHLLDTSEGRETLDKMFTSIIRQEFAGHVVSSVYLIGEGFKMGWQKQTLPVLCNKRRVFQGDNLFAKGAGYDAREIFFAPTLSQFLISCYGRTKVNIGLVVNHAGRDIEQILSFAGVNYYDAGVQMECILDRTDTLQFTINSPITGLSKVFYMKLEDLPERPKKTTRLSINITYKDDSHFTIQVEDKGFGEFFPASDKVYKEEVSIEEMEK